MKPLCVGLSIVLLAACNGDNGEGVAGMSGGECLVPLDDCTPTFPPTFDNIYMQQIRGSCALGGGACHGSAEGQAGLSMLSADAAYDELLGHADGRARVVPGDPECSLLMQRLESPDDDFVMPPRASLSEGQRCAVQKWIESGAPRR